MLPIQTSENQATLDAAQLASLKQSISNYSPLQLAWASGYLAAKSEGGEPISAPSVSAVAATLTILYSSQTGNAKGVAKQLAQQAESAGIAVNLKNIAEYKPKSLKNETHLLIVTSTNGEGEPPDDALEFHEFIQSKKAPKLPKLKFSVLALGDSSYEFYCQTGKDFDNALLALGAQQVSPRVDCDVDYDDEAKAWSLSIIKSLEDELTKSNEPLAPVINLASATETLSLYSKSNPYLAELVVSQKITGRDSAKDVRHIEIDLGDSGLTYQPGDALGVWFDNSTALVGELIAVLNFACDESISLNIDGEATTLTLENALVNYLEITQTSPAFVEFWANQSQAPSLLEVASDKTALRLFAANHQVVDIVNIATAENVNAQQFVDALRKITPRLYSIASSQAEVEEEVHLTVGVVSYEQNGQVRFGGASQYLAERAESGEGVKVFIEHNSNFRLPENSETPVIMIGPGTGVAPFRAFMQQREAQEATGNNWMFFGDQTFTQDFLYQVEWQGYLKSGLLTKMDVAFSRDQAEKVYVQHRILENASEIYAWLERGAHLYICGDADKMAKDVHQALLEVISEQGKMTAEQAESYLKSLRSNKRYQKDVY